MQTIIKQALELLLKLLRDAGRAGAKAVVLPEVQSADKALQRLYSLREKKLPDFSFNLFMDYSRPNTFNDWLVIRIGGKLYKFLVTGEGGDWSGHKKKYRWRSRFVPGFYSNVYMPATIRIGGKSLGKGLKMVKQIKLWNLEEERIQVGGGCHVHRRYSKRKAVANSSAGCIVPFYTVGMDQVYDLVVRSGKEYVNLAVFMKSDFPELNQIKEVLPSEEI